MSPSPADPASPRTLVLLRHGQTDWNVQDRAQGHTDVPLNDAGRAQAAAAAPYLAAMRPARLWSSDLARARQTAAYLARATGLEPVLDARLREYDVGARAGLTKPEFAEKFPDEYAAWLAEDESLLVPGEETTPQVRARVAAGLGDCLAALSPGETGVVVIHGACLKVGLMSLLGWPWEQSSSLRGVDNCGWAIVAEHPVKGGLRLTSYNETASPGPHGLDFASDGPVG